MESIFTSRLLIVTIDMKSIPPRYQLWVEGSPTVHAADSNLLTEGALFIDKKLAEINRGYCNLRRDRNMIGPLSVMEVAAGTFAVLLIKYTETKNSCY